MDVIEHQRNPYEFLYFNQNNISNLKNFETKLKSIIDEFPRDVNIEVQCLPGAFIPSQLDSIDVLVDLTNDIGWKIKSDKYTSDRKIPLISASTSTNSGYIQSIYPVSRQKQVILKEKRKDLEYKLLEQYQNKLQGNSTSGIFAGLVAEEVRKVIFRLDKGDKPLGQTVVYNSQSKKRFDNNLDFKTKGRNDFSNKKILIAGAGALGNFVALHSALMGTGYIDLVDLDEVDVTNLNRQILYFGKVGEKKVEALKSRILEIRKGIKVNAIYGKIGDELSHSDRENRLRLIDEDFIKSQNYDLIFICGDNPAISAKTNQIATKNKLPYINGNSNYNSGNLSIYYGKGYSCLDCLANVDTRAKNWLEEQKKIEEARRRTCIAPEHSPSVVMSNQIIAALMVAEARSILNPSKYGTPLHSRFRYESNTDQRLYLHGPFYPIDGCKYCSSKSTELKGKSNKKILEFFGHKHSGTVSYAGGQIWAQLKNC